MTMTDARGDAVTGCSPRSLEIFERALAQFQVYAGDPLATADQAIAESPGFAMAHGLRAWLFLLGAEAAGLPEARASTEQAKRFAATPRERGHVAALERMIAGEMEAASRIIDDVLLDHPRDALALQAGHLGDFYLGDARSLRDRVARVMPHWSEQVPGYHAVLGMRAFGLEEMHDYALAETAGRRAIELNPGDAWAQHAVAHVMEMQGRVEDGIAWMRANETDWTRGILLAVHNWWHLALFHLDREDHDAVLALYDTHIRGGRSQIVLEMIDASALLWRLNLLGLDVGDRWRELADTWEPLAEDAFYAFDDLHALMAFIGDGRQEAAFALLQAMAARARKPGDNGTMTREVGLPLCRAFMAFGQEDYETCIDLIRPVRNKTHRFGGSNAQRDIIDLTLTEAALRAGRMGLARAVTAERLALKPHSRINLRLNARSTPDGAFAAA